MNLINNNTSTRTLSNVNTTRDDSFKLYKKWIWLFFYLVLFEGALRKWFLPGLSTPLLVVRDPIAIGLLLIAIRQGILPHTFYLRIIFLVGIISVFTAVFLGHGNLIIAVYGARILLIYFPFIFVIGRIFNRNDVIKVGKVLMILSLPMALITAIQFYSPQSAWINRGVGGDLLGAGFSGALGYSRPPGTFSFTSGNALFFGLVASYTFYFWLNVKEINRIILICATVGLLAAIPLSISRTLFYSCFVAAGFALIAAFRKPKYLGKMIFATLVLLVALNLLGRASFFATATEAFTARFEGASQWEGGVVRGTLINRYLGGLITPFTDPEVQESPLLGYGIGSSTNIAVMLADINTTLVYKEDEWQRTIMEIGYIMGLTVIFCRLGLCIKLAVSGYNSLKKGDVLPWMLVSFGSITIPLGQWEQPTALGFSVLIAGLIIASFRTKSYK